MSRVRCTRTGGGRGDTVRWLDTSTGDTYNRERGGLRVNSGFKLQPDGTYSNGLVNLIPTDAAKWYVLRLDVGPDNTVGPLSERAARSYAVNMSRLHQGAAYAVLPVLPGNTVTATPPAPPVPVVNWS